MFYEILIYFVILLLLTSYLATIHCLVDNFEYEVGPYHVKHQEYSQQSIKDVVGRKHFDNLRRLDCSTIQNPGRVHA